MKLSELNPELQPIYRFIPNTPVGNGFGRALVRFGTVRLKPPAPPEGVLVESFTIPGAVGVTVFSPTGGGNGGALFYIHGGGMVIGTPVQDYGTAFRLVQELGIAVVLAGYRLAPEYAFPVPLNDCEAGWKWLLAHAAERKIDTTRLAIGGQSAGGGLAAMLVQRIHDQGGVQPVAQWLFCPMLDDRTAGDRSLDRVGHRLWNNRSNRAGWTALLGVPAGSPTVPPGSVPSRRTDLAGLPDTWIGTGTVELFYTEDVAYATALEAAGVDVTLTEAPGAPHAFEVIAGKTAIAKKYLESAQTWLAARLT